jgi:hypothetical protein
MKKCLMCGIDVSNSKKYCSVECRNQHRKIKDAGKFVYTCANCGKEMSYYRKKKATPSGLYFCSKSCGSEHYHKNSGNKKSSNCEICGEEFLRENSGQVCCSKECSKIYNKNKDMANRYQYTCDNCGENFEVYYKKKGKNTFCSRKCSDLYRSKQCSETRVCEMCGNEFTCQKSEGKKYCSLECGYKHRSMYDVGKNSPTFKEELSNKRIKVCLNCNKEFEIDPCHWDRKKYCSKKCAMAGTITTLTVPHLKVCDMLTKNSINFENEYSVGTYHIDVGVMDNFMIEVMGSYWHCDVRKYEVPKDHKQSESLGKDQRKKKFVENKIGNKILYLWEEDINNKPDLCEKLIMKYLEEKSNLTNYHSMNYELDDNGLKLSDVILIPHFEKKEFYNNTLRD